MNTRRFAHPAIPLIIGELSFLSVTTLKAEAKGAYALRDARIVRVSGPVIDRGTVLVRNGLIEAFGENAVAPADAW